MIVTILGIKYVACGPWSTAAAKTMPDDDMQDVSEAEDEEDSSSSEAEMPEQLASNLPKRGTRGKRCRAVQLHNHPTARHLSCATG